MKKVLRNLFNLLSIVLMGIISFFSCNPAQKEELSSGAEVVLSLPPGPGNLRNSEGDFITLKDGSVLFVYTHFESGGGDYSSAQLTSRISTDGGKTWSQKDKIVVPNEGAMNVMSVSMIRLRDKKIALFYLRKNSNMDCIPYMRLSGDEARTWSDPVRCIPDSGYFVMNNDRVIQLKNGRLLLPVAFHPNIAGKFISTGNIKCYYTDDLKTWNRSGEAMNPEKVVSQEPGVVELKDGRIMMFCRTAAGVQYMSYSKDRGETWSPLEPGNFRSPMSPASIERIPSTGDLLLVWNDNVQRGTRDSGKRTPYNIAVSGDEGKTWTHKKIIESNPFGWYCYTAIFFKDDHVLLAHCSDDLRRTNHLQTTQVNRLSMDWIYAAQTSDPYVVSDEGGVVELACPDLAAEIYYTLDGTLPEDGKGMRYQKPFKIEKSTVVYMEARAKGKTRGNLIKVYVGKDLYREPVSLPAEPVAGLSYTCYSGKVREVKEIERLKPGATGIAPAVGNGICGLERDFALVFAGYLRVPADGLYHFYLDSNDGSVLYLDGSLLIDNDFPHGSVEVSGSMALKAGYHKLELKYFQQGGGKKLRLSWEGPGISKEEIQAAYFYIFDKTG